MNIRRLTPIFLAILFLPLAVIGQANTNLLTASFNRTNGMFVAPTNPMAGSLTVTGETRIGFLRATNLANSLITSNAVLANILARTPFAHGSDMVFYDNFSRTNQQGGLLPPMTSGHLWTVNSGSCVGCTNFILMTNGTVTINTNASDANKPGFYMWYSNTYALPITKFGCTFEFNTPGGAGGYYNTIGLLVSDFDNLATIFTHIGITLSGVYVQPNFATSALNEQYPTLLTVNTVHSAEFIIVSNTITATVAGNRYIAVRDDISSFYVNGRNIGFEIQGSPTNDVTVKFHSVWGGYASAADQVLVGNRGINLDTNGYLRSLTFREGATNAAHGSIALSSGAATVNTTAVLTNSRFALTPIATANAVSALGISNIVSGTSFQIMSASGTDANRVDWAISNVAP